MQITVLSDQENTHSLYQFIQKEGSRRTRTAHRYLNCVSIHFETIYNQEITTIRSLIQSTTKLT